MAFVLDDDQVRLVRKGSVIARTAGIFKTCRAPLTAEELREAAERAIAEDVTEANAQVAQCSLKTASVAPLITAFS